ncbi:MAG: c-type cytochrome, partial [Betaproteobacteria bacterium]|nr:c-type cytochrome [Betaproteobacteria bacterium]
MSQHDETPSAFIKTPQQLILVVLLAFIVPIVAIVLIVQLVVNRPTIDPAGMSAAAVAERIRPVAGEAEMAAAATAAGGKADGKTVYEATCKACHDMGVANAPKLGDKAAWAPRIRTGLATMLKSATIGKNAMPAKGGN